MPSGGHPAHRTAYLCLACRRAWRTELCRRRSRALRGCASPAPAGGCRCPRRVAGVALPGWMGARWSRCKRLQRIPTPRNGYETAHRTTRRRDEGGGPWRRPHAGQPLRTAPPSATSTASGSVHAHARRAALGRSDDLLRRRARRCLDRDRLPSPPGLHRGLGRDPPEGARRGRRPPLRAPGRRTQPRRATPRGLRAGAPRAHRPLLLRAADGLRDPRRRARPERRAAARQRQEPTSHAPSVTWPPGSTASACSARPRCRQPSRGRCGVASRSSSSPALPSTESSSSTVSSSSRPRTPTAPSS